MRITLLIISALVMAGCATTPDCAEQADETARLLERAGVECGVIWSKPFLSTVGHAVNWMNVDGKTLYYDPTIAKYIERPRGQTMWVSEGPVE